jgi:hypothetical protein
MRATPMSDSNNAPDGASDGKEHFNPLLVATIMLAAAIGWLAVIVSVGWTLLR